MQHASVPTGGPDDNVNGVADSEVVDGRAPDPDADPEPSTTLVEVLPGGVVVVFGEVPEALKLDLIDFGIVPERDRALLTTNLMSIVGGNSATIGGNLATAIGGARVSTG